MGSRAQEDLSGPRTGARAIVGIVYEAQQLLCISEVVPRCRLGSWQLDARKRKSISWTDMGLGTFPDSAWAGPPSSWTQTHCPAPAVDQAPAVDPQFCPGLCALTQHILDQETLVVAAGTGPQETMGLPNGKGTALGQ